MGRGTACTVCGRAVLRLNLALAYLRRFRQHFHVAAKRAPLTTWAMNYYQPQRSTYIKVMINPYRS